MSGRSSVGSDGYALGRSEAETERLIVQHQLFGHLTRQFFVSAGITKGMQVLDLGSGAGDVALTLAELVGPQGKVVGVDMNSDILDTARRRVDGAGWSNVEFRHGDVHELALDSEFDAVVGRWVLMYVREPAELLRAVAGRLRPGGVLAFQESDLKNPLRVYPPVPLHEQVVRWTTPPPGTPGPDIEMGPKLFQTYLAAGFPAPQLRVDAAIGGGSDWPGYRYLAGTVRSLLPFLEQIGAVTGRGRHRHARRPPARRSRRSQRNPDPAASVRRVDPHLTQGVSAATAGECDGCQSGWTDVGWLLGGD